MVEAQRKIFMNNQHEDVMVRGVVRKGPNDIGPSNTVSSASLSNLEIEMKGKGIISDSTRPLNPIMKGDTLALRGILTSMKRTFTIPKTGFRFAARCGLAISLTLTTAAAPVFADEIEPSRPRSRYHQR